MLDICCYQGDYLIGVAPLHHSIDMGSNAFIQSHLHICLFCYNIPPCVGLEVWCKGEGQVVHKVQAPIQHQLLYVLLGSLQCHLRQSGAGAPVDPVPCSVRTFIHHRVESHDQAAFVPIPVDYVYDHSDALSKLGGVVYLGNPHRFDPYTMVV